MVSEFGVVHRRRSPFDQSKFKATFAINFVFLFLDHTQLEPAVPLPSPNDLKRKIIIKNKKLRRDTEKGKRMQAIERMAVRLTTETVCSGSNLEY